MILEEQLAVIVSILRTPPSLGGFIPVHIGELRRIHSNTAESIAALRMAKKALENPSAADMITPNAITAIEKLL